MSKIHSRRAILAGIAAVPALAAPAIALKGAGPDPIFAAIEHHRGAAQALTAVVDEQAELEISGVPKDGSRWGDFERRSDVIYNQLKDARRQLFEAPTSVAGLVALFEYMEEQRRAGNGDWDDAWSLPTQDEMLFALVGTVRRLGASS
jgi:hypothetical protein